MKNIAADLIIFILKIKIINVVSIPDVLLDYCGPDFFAADCPTGYVVLIEEARYGRMELGTCLQLDFGSMGCSREVIPVVDQWCSGRQSCRFRVRTMGDISNPCPQEVTSYLQAKYSCIKVIIPQNDCCQMPESNVIHDAKDGFIASSTTENTGCGVAVCPWIIQAPIGQLLNISLYDFGTYSSGLLRKGDENDVKYESRCHVYGLINEKETSDTSTICSGDVRVKHLYTSSSNIVEIHFANNLQNGLESSFFMVGFEAIGCPDPDPPLNEFVRREGSQAALTCFSNGNEWHIPCRDNAWQGDLNICDMPTTTISAGGRNITSFITDEVFIVFVVAVTLVISVAIVTTGVVCLQRYRTSLSMAENGKQESGMRMNSLDGAYAAQDFEYNTENLPRHYHRENYIYYLSKMEAQSRIGGAPSKTERENDNGYYSDHTYESPRCEHTQLKNHLTSANTGLDSNQIQHELRTFKTKRDPKQHVFGTMHGNELSFPKPKRQCSQEPCFGNKTV